MRKISKSLMGNVDVLLIRFTGIVALFSIPFEHLSGRIHGFLPILPVTSHFVALIVGILLLYIASQIRQKKRTAYIVAIVSLVLLIIAQLHHHGSWQLVLYTVTLTAIVKDRHKYVVKSDVISLRQGVITACGILLAVMLFFVIMIEMIEWHRYGRDLTTGETISVTFQSILGDPLPESLHPTKGDAVLVDLLRTAGVVGIAIAIISLFRPLQIRHSAPRAQIFLARRIISKHSDSTEDFFKLWPRDKHYFFYEDSFVAYKISGSIALVLDGATGQTYYKGRVRKAFLDYANQNGWSTVIIHADEDEANKWQKYGLEQMFIGSEAIVELDEFAERTVRSKHFRYIKNKATKDGLEFEVWSPPLSNEQILMLQKVSDLWLSKAGRREYTFIMGYFDEEYLADCQVMVLRRDKEVVAYTNLIPTFVKQACSIDHMRSVPSVSGVEMHYLLMQTAMYKKEQGYKTLNLGLSPLSQLEEKIDKNISERILAGIKKFGGRYYSFGGLEQFKNKFKPVWQKRYIVYAGGPTKLPAIGSSLNNATAYKPARSKNNIDVVKMFLRIGAIIVGLCYSSFLLAIFINRSLLLDGFASVLGQSGQPYAWIFNGADIVAGFLGFLILVVGYWLFIPQKQFMKYALVAGVLAMLGGGLAGIITLPANFNESQGFDWAVLFEPKVLMHGIASFVNSAGFVLSVVLWAVAYWRVDKNALPRKLLAGISVLIATVGYIVGLIWPDTSGILQRLFIICFSVWIIWFVYDLTKTPRK